LEEMLRSGRAHTSLMEIVSLFAMADEFQTSDIVEVEVLT